MRRFDKAGERAGERARCPGAGGGAGAQRGSMLIVALGILVLMSLMAVTFVTLMKLEKTATVNYIDSLRAKMTAEAGMTRVLASLKQNLNKPLFDGNQLAPHVFGRNGREVDVTIDVEAVTARDHPFFYGYTGRQYSNNQPIEWGNPDTIVGLDEYKVKVIETSALLDLNHPTEFELSGQPVEGQVFQLMLEALGQAIASRQGFDPVRQARFTGPGGSFTGARAIIAYRATLDGDHFTSKSQLRELFEEDSNGDYAFDMLTDFVTAHAWRDHKAVRPPASGGDLAHHQVEPEQRGRAQINLNLAPREVLAAVIAPLAGRRYAYLTETASQLIEQGNEENYFGAARPSGYQLEEDTAFRVREGYVYIGPIGVQRAERIADWIIAQRPFVSMAHFHQRLVEEADKQAGALDGYLPAANDVQARIMPSNEPRYSLVGIHQQPWFPDWVRKAGYSLLMANFNPAFCSNTLNPNQAAAYPIDKASLVFPTDWSRPDPRSTMRSRQTLDGCFDSRGVYELVSLGQILGQEGEILAKEKVFTVVRTFDMMVHRSQTDFETNDRTYAPSGGGGAERYGITTYPENRTFFTANDVSQKADTPDPMVASAYGHLELNPRIRYDFYGDVLPVREVASADWGTPLFGALFEGFRSGLNPGHYLHASHANQVDLPAHDAPDVYAKARGSAIRRAFTSSNWRATAGNGTLFRDGFYSSYRKARDLSLWFRAAAAIEDDLAQGALGLGTGAPPPGTNDSQQGNVWYRRGGLEFWYKPDFDWSFRAGGQFVPTPLTCGYVFASRVYYNPGDPSAMPVPAPLTDCPTDGTQLFLVRNSAGQLRATRLYFRVVGLPRPGEEKPAALVDPVPGDPYPASAGTHFETGGNFVYGGGTGGAIDLYREAAERRPDDPTTPDIDGYNWPPAEMKPDTNILRARTDAYVSYDRLAQWRANEWHHIAVAWDDSLANPDQALRIYVDGVKQSTSHGMPSTITDDTRNMFVRLNEPPEITIDGQTQRFPKDHLYVAGIERNLAERNAGLFKHTNTVALAGSDRIIDSQIRLFACGTVDDFVTWDLGTPANRDRLQNVLQFGRFERLGEYIQHFDLDSKFPGGTSPLQLARLSVTALLPTRHGENAPALSGRGSVVVSIEEPVGVRMRHPRTGQVVSGLAIDRMNDYTHVELIGPDGRPALLVPPADPTAPRPTLRYKLALHAATFQPGGQTPQMSAVDTPVVQEVAVSWFLPTEETLLRERIYD